MKTPRLTSQSAKNLRECDRGGFLELDVGGFAVWVASGDRPRVFLFLTDGTFCTFFTPAEARVSLKRHTDTSKLSE